MSNRKQVKDCCQGVKVESGMVLVEIVSIRINNIIIYIRDTGIFERDVRGVKTSE